MKRNFWLGLVAGILLGCCLILLVQNIFETQKDSTSPKNATNIFSEFLNSENKVPDDKSTTSQNDLKIPTELKNTNSPLEVIRNCELPPTTDSCHSICESQKQVENVLLPAPEFKKPATEVLQMSTSEEVRLEWSPVSHASQYRVLIRDQQQNVINTLKTKESFIQISRRPLKGANAGTFLVSLATVNRHGTIGEEGPVKTIVVKKEDVVKAPDINNIQIED